MAIITVVLPRGMSVITGGVQFCGLFPISVTVVGHKGSPVICDSVYYSGGRLLGYLGGGTGILPGIGILLPHPQMTQPQAQAYASDSFPA